MEAERSCWQRNWVLAAAIASRRPRTFLTLELEVEGEAEGRRIELLPGPGEVEGRKG